MNVQLMNEDQANTMFIITPAEYYIEVIMVIHLPAMSNDGSLTVGVAFPDSMAHSNQGGAVLGHRMIHPFLVVKLRHYQRVARRDSKLRQSRKPIFMRVLCTVHGMVGAIYLNFQRPSYIGWKHFLVN